MLGEAVVPAVRDAATVATVAARRFSSTEGRGLVPIRVSGYLTAPGKLDGLSVLVERRQLLRRVAEVYSALDAWRARAWNDSAYARCP